MSDFMSVQPVSAIGMAVRPTPPAPSPQVAKPVDTGSPRSATDYGQSRDPQRSAAAAEEFAGRRRFDKNVQTGPPPAFQATLLDVEANIDAAIERLDEAREKHGFDQYAQAYANAVADGPEAGRAVAAAPATEPERGQGTDDPDQTGGNDAMMASPAPDATANEELI